MTHFPFFDRDVRGSDVQAAPACVLLHDGQASFHAPGDAFTTVLIALGSCTVQRFIAGHWFDMRAIYRGGILLADLAGSIRLSGPSVVEAAVFFVPKSLMVQTLGHLNDRLRPNVAIEIPADVVVIGLLKALMASSTESLEPGIDVPVRDAILMRLSLITRQTEVPAKSDPCALPAWRLRRVSEMVKERLCTTITLSDMAEAAGLSPMYFAAQFKKSTGLRPHEYLVAQRIEHAKNLLRENKASLYDVALNVGFRTQAHFSTVFKKYEHTTPARWRKERLAA